MCGEAADSIAAEQHRWAAALAPVHVWCGMMLSAAEITRRSPSIFRYV